MPTKKDLDDLTDNGLGNRQALSMTEVKRGLIKDCIVKLGDTLMIEFDLSSAEEVDKLPDDTVLPPDAEVLYYQLKELLKQ